MQKQKQPTFYGNLKSPFKSIGGVSPMKQLGEGIGQLFGARGAKRRAAEEQGLADTEFGGARANYLSMDFSNPYANAAAVGSLIILNIFNPAINPASFVAFL